MYSKGFYNGVGTPESGMRPRTQKLLEGVNAPEPGMLLCAQKLLDTVLLPNSCIP